MSARPLILLSALIAMPGFAAAPGGGSAYIAQIGDGQTARIVQSAPAARAEIRQEGDRNEAALTQSGAGVASATIHQSGTLNRAEAAQGGPGDNVLLLSQLGAGNSARANQFASDATNYAAMTQTGSGNAMTLAQNGADNRATLTQTGDNDAMTATQNGAGNRLAWSQLGSNLADLGIVQSGAQQMTITQTAPGR